jgi:hypothetical protein
MGNKFYRKEFTLTTSQCRRSTQLRGNARMAIDEISDKPNLSVQDSAMDSPYKSIMKLLIAQTCFSLTCCTLLKASSMVILCRQTRLKAGRVGTIYTSSKKYVEESTINISD